MPAPRDAGQGDRATSSPARMAQSEVSGLYSEIPSPFKTWIHPTAASHMVMCTSTALTPAGALPHPFRYQSPSFCGSPLFVSSLAPLPVKPQWTLCTLSPAPLLEAHRAQGPPCLHT